MSRNRPLILIADFFGSVKERGIGAYVRDLEAIAAPMADVIPLRAPAWVRRQPQGVQNLLMVAHEQLAVPLYAAWYCPDLIVYPYNSSSILLSLLKRTVCVIHDLIPYQAQNRGSRFALAYVACTARWHARIGRRLVAVSPFTARALRALPRFRRSKILTIPNCFAGMAVVRDNVSRLSLRRATLISGIGPNKAFGQALELMAAVAGDPRFAGLAFDIVGFGAEYARAEELIAAMRTRGLVLPPVTVHPLLPRAELDRLIAGNAVMWAHSLAEGFGRAVVEGRMAGRPVVMSRLPVFRPLRDDYTFPYDNSNADDFKRALAEALDVSDETQPYLLIDRLRADAASGLKELLRQ